MVMDMNQVELLVVFLVLLELYLEMVDKVHGVTVHLQDQVVVLQVYSLMVPQSLELAVVAVAEDQVVVTMVVEPLMVAMLAVTL